MGQSRKELANNIKKSPFSDYVTNELTGRERRRE